MTGWPLAYLLLNLILKHTFAVWLYCFYVLCEYLFYFFAFLTVLHFGQLG